MPTGLAADGLPCMAGQTQHFIMPAFFNAERQVLRAQQLAPETLADLHNWFPVTLINQHIAWRHHDARFSMPFFADTLQQQTPVQRQVCLTPLPHSARLALQLQQLPVLTPSAFIFHISRCGSTLLTQLLSTLPQCIVMSEPPVIDAILRASPQPDVVLLRQMILALGQRRFGESHYVIKLDSWHLPHLSLLRSIFPDTPCWFLYRDPQAVLASHQRQRGPQMVPGLILPPQLGDGSRIAGDLDGYCLQVLAWLFKLALEHNRHLHLLNYSQLPDAVWQDLLPGLGLPPSAGEIVAMQTRAGFHAKDHASAFHGDPGSHLPPAVQHLLQQQVLPLYQQLEQQRCRILKID